MTAFTGIVFRTEFVDSNFAGTCVTNHGAGNIGIGNRRLTNAKGLTLTNGEDIKFNGRTDLCIQRLNAKNIILVDAILLTTCAYHSVHFQTSILKTENACLPAGK